MVICCVNGCHNRSDRSPTEGVSFFRFPTVFKGPDEHLRQQTSDRRALWLVRVDRREISAGARVCSEHFVRGKPAPVTATNDVDWAPTLKLSDTSPSAEYVHRQPWSENYQQDHSWNQRHRIIQLSVIPCSWQMRQLSAIYVLMNQ